ncbi:MAG: hypothetical protein ACKV19_09670 [Verrucomicrobiales bacterium]
MKTTAVTLAATIAMLGLSPAGLTQEPEKITQPGAISGTMNIAFNTRTNLTDKGKPAKGAKDVYEVALNVAKTTEFRGKIERQPLIVSDILGRQEQPGQLQYAINLAVFNPVDMTQKKTVGKWVGTVPINAGGIYQADGPADSRHRISVDAIGRAPAFTDNFGGRLLGKGKKSSGVISYIRKVQGKEVKMEVKNSDPMKFENLLVAAGPSQNYPKVTVNGNLDYDYETGNWLTNGIRFTYTYNGKAIEDVVSGSIKWVEDENRASNGKGQYEFNLRWNESANAATSTEADAFAALSDEEAFFAVDNSIPSLTGTVKYEDVLRGSGDEAVPTSSKVTYALDANQLTKQQVMNFVKLWLVCVGPTNDE